MLVACTINIDDKTIMTTGGNIGDKLTEDTAVYDFETKSWSEGPKMITGRDGHGCAKFELEGKPILVVSGGCSGGKSLDSVEILDWQNEQDWIEGIIKEHFCYGTYFNKTQLFSR